MWRCYQEDCEVFIQDTTPNYHLMWNKLIYFRSNWYFVSEIVLNHCDKKLFYWLRRTFDITRTIYWNPTVKCQKKFWYRFFFLLLIEEQLKCQFEQKLWCWNLQEQVGTHFFSHSNLEKNVCTWDKNPKSKAKLEYPNLEFWALKVVLIKRLYVLLENKKYICSANIHAKAMGATIRPFK